MKRSYPDRAAFLADLNERAARVAETIKRIDTRGMTRPKRDPIERAFLEAHGLPTYFVESDGPPLRRRDSGR
jgi:hypothetical protein